MPTGFGQTRSVSQRGVYRMVFRARDEQVGRTALSQGHALLMAAINDEPFDVEAAVAAVREAIDDCYLGPSTACIVAAATERGIPHIRLNDGNLVQLGYGARQRRIWTAETDLTSAIAENIACDKDLTKMLLQACGVPVPEGQIVASAAEAWEAAQDIGLPVVVKPSDGNHGRGVALDLRQQADIEAAFALADSHGSEVIVERCIPGDEHRLLVVGGKVVAAARGESLDHRRRQEHRGAADRQPDQRRPAPRHHRGPPAQPPERHPPGPAAPGLRPHRRAAGRPPVLVQRNGNVAIDCTDEVHPEVAHVVSLAARAVGLDIAGVDLVCEDIGRPLAEQGGAIVEVNAGPGLLMHLKPAEGTPRPVGQQIVEHLFPRRGRTPPRPHPHRRRGRQRRLHLHRPPGGPPAAPERPTALACADGLFLGHRRTEKAGKQYWDACHRLLMNREAQAAVFENPAALILDNGLPYDRCHVGVVTDLGGHEDLAHHDITEADQLYRVLRTQIDVVLSDGVGVLNGNDARVAEMAGLCDGEVLFYACEGADGLPACVADHLSQGGRAAVMAGQRVSLRSGASEQGAIELGQILQRRGQSAGPARLQALLAAVATAWAFGISPELIAAGIETFEQPLA
jgi:cyanophycin synthetase